MTRRAHRLLGTGLLGVAVGAGASVPAAAATSNGPKACAVLTKAEIRRVVDAPVRRAAREQGTPKSATICNWDVDGRNRGELVSVWVQRGRQAREGYDVSERTFGLGGESLPDLGPTAFFSAEAGAVYVLRGSEFLYVQRLDQTGATPDTTLRDQAVELAGLALERL